MPDREYESNADRQRAYRERQKRRSVRLSLVHYPVQTPGDLVPTPAQLRKLGVTSGAGSA